jgi:aspartyl-tRNA(Asn)/glutamyl-tRNA(Gln) amidotransferase subunit A
MTCEPPNDRVTIAALRDRLDRGEVTATDLIAEREARLRGRRGPALFQLLEWGRAYDAAHAWDAAKARGAPPGPLGGVPMAHKDMFDRAGVVTGFGAHRSAARTAKLTAPVLRRLDVAGAVDFGRLVMSEFAMGPTGINHHHGMPENPTVPGAIPGGSSSGSGVAVAAGLVPAALGSDTGGSIRLPAACNGVVGFKPGQGKTPMDGVMPLSWTQDCIGPLAASVACARLVMSLISGGAVNAHGTRRDGLRIGLDRGAFTGEVSAAVHAAMTEAAGALRHAGHSIVGVDLGFFADLDEPANVIAISEAATVHADRLRADPDSYGPEVRARLVQAAAIPAQAYLRARQIRARAAARLNETVFAAVDLLILPTLPATPPMADSFRDAQGAELSAMISRLTTLTRPASILGLPALSLPVAWTSTGPISAQIVGPPGAEDLVADLSEMLEALMADAINTKTSADTAATMAAG